MEKSLERRGFTFQDQIATGSFSKVFKAMHRDTVTEEVSTLACKRIDKEEATQAFLEHFFPRELEALMKLVHPNIIEIHSIFTNSSHVFIFMRWAEKGDLLTFLKEHKIVVEKQANLWFYQMVLAFKYIHEAGIAHRDLKCENILISRHNNIKITDFGFARQCIGEMKEKILSQTYCGSECKFSLLLFPS